MRDSKSMYAYFKLLQPTDFNSGNNHCQSCTRKSHHIFLQQMANCKCVVHFHFTRNVFSLPVAGYQCFRPNFCHLCRSKKLLLFFTKWPNLTSLDSVSYCLNCRAEIKLNCVFHELQTCVIFAKFERNIDDYFRSVLHFLSLIIFVVAK